MQKFVSLFACLSWNNIVITQRMFTKYGTEV